jgi:hypothetical protein
MKGLSRKKPKVNDTSLLDALPADFWQFAHGMSLFSQEEWARLAAAGIASIPAEVSFDVPRCIGCGRLDDMAYDEWLRAEGYLTRCYCKGCFCKAFTVVSCSEWLPHVHRDYPDVRTAHADTFMCKEPMKNTKSAIARFVEGIVRTELMGNGYIYKADQMVDLERIIRRTAELFREILPKVAPYGRRHLYRVIGMIAVGVCGLGL